MPETLRFDMAVICTPNHRHEPLARLLVKHTDKIVVEKPGFESLERWTKFQTEYPRVKLFMVKNNMYRTSDIEFIREQIIDYGVKAIKVFWINKNRVPGAGSWFTNKELAFGGVSRDLMPHLLSWFIALAPDWVRANLVKQTAFKRWTLGQLTGTDYGTVNVNGIYDVDDFCQINFTDKWQLTADWRDLNFDKRNIEFVMEDDSVVTVELGLCPEYAYQNMIADAIKNVDNQSFWLNQYNQDLWIHERIENL
jgi:predicted dehydrogenase